MGILSIFSKLLKTVGLQLYALIWEATMEKPEKMSNFWQKQKKEYFWPKSESENNWCTPL